MTTPATVTSVTTSPANGVEHVGDTVTFTIAFDSAITVSGGTPTLTLNDGGIAVYDAAATAALGDPAKLIFTYTVATSDQSVTGLSFVRGDQNGAVIFDTSTGQGPDFTNLFRASFPGVQVATSPTAVTSVVTSPASGVEHTGNTVTFTIAFSRAVTISGGAPTLTLNDGGTAIYDAAATAALGDPTKAVFTYTVGASDRSTTGLSFVRGDQNGAVIVDPSGLGPDFSALFTATFPYIQIKDEITVNTAIGKAPGSTQVITLANGNFAVTWQDSAQGIYGPQGSGGATGDDSGLALKSQVFTASGIKIGTEVLVNTATKGDQTRQKMTALANGGFVVTWADGWISTDGSQGVGGATGDSSGTAIKAQVFAADGSKIGSEILVNTATAGNQTDQAITALSNGSFVVTWTDGSVGGSDDNIKAQVFAADGTKIGSELLVNTATYYFQEHSAVTALANGGFVVTWGDDSQGIGGAPGDNDFFAVKAQVFAANGAQVSAEILVNTTTAGRQDYPSIVALSDGGFAITWRSTAPGMNLGVQAFAADGTKVGSETRIVDAGGSGQRITALSNGGFAVTWDDYSAVKTQVFAADGTAVSSQTQVNTATGGYQLYPQVTALSDGGFVVTWEDGSQGVGGATGDTSGSAIKAQMFAGDGTKIGSEILVNVSTAYDQADSRIAALPNGGFTVTWTDYGTGNVKSRVFGPDPSTTAIAAGTTPEIATATQAHLAFAPEGAALQLDHSTAFIGEIAGFGGADTIDLRDVIFGSGTTLGYKANSSNAGGTLVVSDGTHTSALALLGQYTATSFAVASDGHGGTIIASASAATQANTLAPPHA